MNQNITEIFNILSSKNTNPKTELKYVNDYTLLVAVILSAQSTDVSVNKACEPLFFKVNSPKKMLELGIDGLKNYIKTIGLNNTKAKNIIAMSEKLINNFENKVPSTMENLITLPGVGRKTANVILNTLFNKNVIAVDTHVFRVSHRLNLVNKSANTPEKVEMQLHKNIPSQHLKNAHHLLILHGRYTCKARTPNCDKCEIKDFCPFYKNLAF